MPLPSQNNTKKPLQTFISLEGFEPRITSVHSAVTELIDRLILRLFNNAVSTEGGIALTDMIEVKLSLVLIQHHAMKTYAVAEV
jgi:hypothetical protein